MAYMSINWSQTSDLSRYQMFRLVGRDLDIDNYRCSAALHLTFGDRCSSAPPQIAINSQYIVSNKYSLKHLPHPNPCFALRSRLYRLLDEWSVVSASQGYRSFTNPPTCPRK